MSVKDYRINLYRTRFGFRAVVDGADVGKFHHPPAYWRRSREKALARAQRWCERDAAKRYPVEHLRLEVKA